MQGSLQKSTSIVHLNDKIDDLSRSEIQKHIHNDKIQDTQKLIDFNELTRQYSDLTEYSLPFST